MDKRLFKQIVKLEKIMLSHPKTQIRYSYLALIGLLVACQSIDGSEYISRFTSTPQEVVVSFTPTLIKTPTIMLTTTPIPKPTWTQPPRLNTGEAEDQFLAWLEGDPECRLPCWAGITPGITTWEEVKHIFYPILNYGELSEKGDCYFGACNRVSWSHISAPSPYEAYIYAKTSDNLIYRIYLIDQYPEIPIFPIDELLNELGEPGQVYLSTFNLYSGNKTTPFEILIVYPNHNLVVYYLRETERVGDMITGCKNDRVEGVRLTIGVDDGEVWDVYKAKRMIFGESNVRYFNLEDVTDMSVRMFYEKFKDDPNACISTPRDRW
ncbi:MAG: hypothetical protein OEY93_09110 [Anaerolineae bacterium]|nr:hypothetical protein [Anaerolineae bacterium]